MRIAQNKLRMIWADKIALALAILLVAIPAIGWGLVALATGTMGANHVLASIGTEGALEVAAVVFAVWASFRAMDYVAHGATYKLFHAEQVADAPVAQAPVLPSGRNLLAQ
jgi:hypothetical protein